MYSRHLLHPQGPWPANAQRSTLDAQRSTLDAQRSTGSTLNAQRPTLNAHQPPFTKESYNPLVRRHGKVQEGKPFVLLSTSFAIEDSSLGRKNLKQIMQIRHKVETAILDALRGTGEVSATECWDVTFIGEQGTNSRICESCGSWATDRNEPDPIGAFPSGTVREDGRFSCEECDDWATLDSSPPT